MTLIIASVSGHVFDLPTGPLDMSRGHSQTVAYSASCCVLRTEVEITIQVCPLSALSRGEALRVEAEPPIAVFHTEEGEVFAIDDTCTHQDASLSEGWLEGCQVECPLHASKFDLRTGQVDALPAKKPVRTHAVVIEDDHIFVQLSQEAPNLPPGVTLGSAS